MTEPSRQPATEASACTAHEEHERLLADGAEYAKASFLGGSAEGITLYEGLGSHQANGMVVELVHQGMDVLAARIGRSR